VSYLQQGCTTRLRKAELAFTAIAGNGGRDVERPSTVRGPARGTEVLVAGCCYGPASEAYLSLLRCTATYVTDLLPRS